VKAVALYSGGLDSMLCAKTLLQCGVEVLGLTILVPAFIQSRVSRDKLLASAASIGLPLEIIDISEEYLAMVKSPLHGYGSQHNPCIDCKILFLRKAKEKMEREGAYFVATGEVLEQRPMSQKRRTLLKIERHAGLEGYVVRPLSALVLDPTIPEREGWLDRSQLHGFSGRGRKDQMRLAREYGIQSYPTPGGGCLLTEQAFSKRFSDLVEHGHCDLKNVQLLKIGRHFRFSKQVKLVVGRNEQENRRIEELAHDGDVLLGGDGIPGPTGIIRGLTASDNVIIEAACAILARYCDKNGSHEVPVVIKMIPGSEARVVRVTPASEESLSQLRICHA
jgi:tRNA-uridine 2-sulfurtransferase